MEKINFRFQDLAVKKGSFEGLDSDTFDRGCCCFCCFFSYRKMGLVHSGNRRHQHVERMRSDLIQQQIRWEEPLSLSLHFDFVWASFAYGVKYRMLSLPPQANCSCSVDDSLRIYGCWWIGVSALVWSCFPQWYVRHLFSHSILLGGTTWREEKFSWL